MKMAGAGRILLWNGGSLWIGSSGGATDFHAHHAVQIALADSGLLLRCPDEEWTHYPAGIIAANQSHAFDGRGAFVAMIFLEPESRAGQNLQHRCRAERITALAAEVLAPETHVLFSAYHAKADDAALQAAARAIITKLANVSDASAPTLDPRILRAIAHVRGNIGADVQLAAAAAVACLSPDRFRHLFLEQTGIRFRPYVLWLRIELAVAAYATHHSLTEAAHAGGFADSAHFTRTFRRMFGIAPSSISID